MTTVLEHDVVCGQCGTKSRQRFMGSTFEHGWPDLDGRPSEGRRSTMSLWLQECPSCGHVAPSLDRCGEGVSKVLASPEYRAAVRDERLSPLARRFVRRAIIEERTGHLPLAAERFLQAAWVADDARDGEQARALRRRAATCLRRAFRGNLIPEANRRDMAVCLVDVLRRSHQWFEADALCARLLRAEDEPVRARLLAFLFERIGDHDADVYTVGEALGKETRAHLKAGTADGAVAEPAAQPLSMRLWWQQLQRLAWWQAALVLAVALPLAPIVAVVVCTMTLLRGRIPVTMRPWWPWLARRLSPDANAAQDRVPRP